MKYIIGFLSLACSLNSYAEFLHPLDYKGTEAQNKQLEEHISQQVKKEQCSTSKETCDKKMQTTKALELKAFQKLTKLSDRNKIDGLTKIWCAPNEEPCYYGIILMMYNN